MQLTWKTPTTDESTSLWSEVADGEDYYFVYGPALDKVVAGCPVPVVMAGGPKCDTELQVMEFVHDGLKKKAGLA